MLSLLGAWVQFPVKELRTCTLQDEAKNKFSKKLKVPLDTTSPSITQFHFSVLLHRKTLFKKFIYLAVQGLSRGMWDLQDPFLFRQAESLIIAHEPLVAAGEF